VAGWAIDEAAATGTGVDTLHVWAYPASGSPIFVGAAGYGGARGDIGTAYGPQFTNAGFSLTGSLPPGSYDLIVYALIEACTARFHCYWPSACR
jgi:hypothetical protein